MYTRRQIWLLGSATLSLAAVPAANALQTSPKSKAFTEELWRRGQPIYDTTLEHPFLRGLRDGTLPKEKFRYYLVQDALYLRAFGQALNLLAAKAPREDWAIALGRHAIGAIEAERELHESILRDYGVALAATEKSEMAPVNRAYTNHILATVSLRPFIEGLSAVLPCYWVYLEVGKNLIRRGSPNPEYQRWINQYGGDDYAKTVQEVLTMMNTLAETETQTAKSRCLDIYERSTRYEFLFWDMAWREERWLP